jgi:hypothetical protein
MAYDGVEYHNGQIQPGLKIGTYSQDKPESGSPGLADAVASGVREGLGMISLGRSASIG